jgi:hypothetical protein
MHLDHSPNWPLALVLLETRTLDEGLNGSENVIDVPFMTSHSPIP